MWSKRAHVTLRLEQEQVARILVEGQMIQGTLKAVDAKQNTVTASVSMSKLEPPVDKTFTVVKNAKLFIDDGQPVDKTKPVKSPKLCRLASEYACVDAHVRRSQGCRRNPCLKVKVFTASSRASIRTRAHRCCRGRDQGPAARRYDVHGHQ